jgi:hypothetical protein
MIAVNNRLRWAGERKHQMPFLERLSEGGLALTGWGSWPGIWGGRWWRQERVSCDDQPCSLRLFPGVLWLTRGEVIAPFMLFKIDDG